MTLCGLGGARYPTMHSTSASGNTSNEGKCVLQSTANQVCTPQAHNRERRRANMLFSMWITHQHRRSTEQPQWGPADVGRPHRGGAGQEFTVQSIWCMENIWVPGWGERLRTLLRPTSLIYGCCNYGDLIIHHSWSWGSPLEAHSGPLWQALTPVPAQKNDFSCCGDKLSLTVWMCVILYCCISSVGRINIAWTDVSASDYCNFMTSEIKIWTC